jgi:hypothetical protein
MTKKSLGLKQRLQTADPDERATILDGLPHSVGFGKPPQHTRFRKGASGNRRGRPTGSEDLGKVAVQEFNERIEVREHGKTRRLSKQRVAMRQLSNQAANGDPKAIALLLEIQKKTGVLGQTAAPSAPALDARDMETFARLALFLEGEPGGDQAGDEESGSDVGT